MNVLEKMKKGNAVFSQWRRHIHAHPETTALVEWREGYIPVVNAPAETRLCRKVAAQVVGAENVREFTPTMGGEDFAYFLQECPGAFIMLGQGRACNNHGLHSPHYDFNDDVIPLGAAYWVNLAEASLLLKEG
ncbi:MAG: M20/M25/M40 family metallo-hydrolase [Pseudomonadota bacterium]